MRSRYIFVLLLLVASIAVGQPAPIAPTDTEKAASKKGSDDAWSWGNAFVVKNYFDQVYYPHAMALLNAEKQLNPGSKAADIVKTLSALPGIKGAVVIGGGNAQWPDSLVKLDALTSILFNSRQSDKPKSQIPMMERTVGGKVKYQQVPLGDKFLDLMVRYVHADTLPGVPVAAISLVMDRKWLTAQIPAAMDSLYRENSQLLFCAASPSNHLWEQSLGVVADKDTLWWTGRKDVKIRNVQTIWPFAGVEVYSYVHTLEKK
jgi:hypothetical protein